jgi:hypothetical protein
VKQCFTCKPAHDFCGLWEVKRKNCLTFQPQSSPLLAGKAVGFCEMFPRVARLRIEIQEQSDGMWWIPDPWHFTEKNLRPGVDCAIQIPDFARFSAHAATRAARGQRPCSPKTSLIADAKNGFTHGRLWCCSSSRFPIMRSSQVCGGRDFFYPLQSLSIRQSSTATLQATYMICRGDCP